MSSTPALPLVTVGMPVRGGERYMHQRFQNLLALDYPNLEIIYSDDASPDRSREIAREYAAKDSRIRVVTREKPLGVGGNFGWLMDEAKGKYFFLAAQDDLHEPSFVRQAVGLLEANPGCWGACVDWRFMDNDGKPVDYPERDGRLLDTRDLSLSQKLGFFMQGPAGFYLYNLWRLEPLRRERIRMVELGSYPYFEYPWILAILLRGDVAKVSEFLFTYRLHIGGGLMPKPSPHSVGLTVPPEIWEATSEPRRAFLYLERYGEICEAWAGADRRKARRAKRRLWAGAFRSYRGSVDWYERCKHGLKPAWRRALGEKAWKEAFFLSVFLILKIKPLRWLIRQRVGPTRPVQG